MQAQPIHFECSYSLTAEEAEMSSKTLQQVLPQIYNHNILALRCGRDEKIGKIVYISTNNSCQDKIEIMFDLTPFASLQELWMNHNKIASVENMIAMHMPHMRKLSFSYNCLSSVQALRRMHLPSLVQLQLDHNPISDPALLVYLQLSRPPATLELSLWLYFSEASLQRNMHAKCINAKVWPCMYKK